MKYHRMTPLRAQQRHELGAFISCKESGIHEWFYASYD